MGRGRSDNAFWAVGICSCCSVLITGFVLLGLSFKVLDSNDLGLDVDNFSQTISDRLYEGGTHFIGFTHELIKYPRASQTMKFSSERGSTGGPIRARTADGLPIDMSFACNYRLKQAVQELTRLYLQYGDMDAVEDLYTRIARNVVRVVASNYVAAEVIEKQRDMQSAMQTLMTSELDQQGGIVDSSGFSLMEIGLPAEFRDARARTQAAENARTQAENELVNARIVAQTRVQRAMQEAELIVTAAEAAASAARLATGATIQSLQARYAAEGESYGLLKVRLNMTSAELLQYVWLDAQQAGAGAAQTTINLAKPAELQ